MWPPSTQSNHLTAREPVSGAIHLPRPQKHRNPGLPWSRHRGREWTTRTHPEGSLLRTNQKCSPTRLPAAPAFSCAAPRYSEGNEILKDNLCPKPYGSHPSRFFILTDSSSWQILHLDRNTKNKEGQKHHALSRRSQPTTFAGRILLCCM